MGIKVELVLIEMYGNLFWSSTLEIAIFNIMFILFLTDSSELGDMWWFIVHVIRGFIGLAILRNLPMTHDIIKTANSPPDE